MLKKSKKSGSEVSYEVLEETSGGRIVDLEKHPKFVPSKMTQELASEWGEGEWKYAILSDDEDEKLLGLAKDEIDAMCLDINYNHPEILKKLKNLCNKDKPV